MKKLNRIFLLFVVLTTFSLKGHSQNFFLKALATFNELTEGVGKLLQSTSSIDTLINSNKVKKMAGELYTDVSELILAKEAVVFTLEHDTFDESKYKTHVKNLQIKLDALRKTLDKYGALMKAAGVNSQKLNYELKQDFLEKANTLDRARGLMDRNASEMETKQTLITYFKSCVNILKTTQAMLSSYKP